MKKLLLLIISLMFVFSCSIINPIDNGTSDSAIQLQINFDNSVSNVTASNKLQKNLNTTSSIERVAVIVTAPDIERAIDKDLQFNASKATGTITVPKGNNRTFRIEGFDDENFLQFEGETTKNIKSDKENVNITVQWIAPATVAFWIEDITAYSAKIVWEASDAQDFEYYRILLGETSELIPYNESPHIVSNIYDRNENFLIVENLNPETLYFYEVLVVDRENWFKQVDTQSFLTDQSFEVGLFQDFETPDEVPDWESIDLDGDSYEWGLFSLEEHNVGHESYQCAASASYIEVDGVPTPLTPDNWLISPAFIVPAGGVLEYWVAAQDPNWSQEHYEVRLCPMPLALPDEFDLALFDVFLYEETLPENTDEWFLRTLDISSFAGEVVHVAFRHCNVTDMFIIKIDDVAVGTPTQKTPQIKFDFDTPEQIKQFTSIRISAFPQKEFKNSVK